MEVGLDELRSFSTYSSSESPLIGQRALVTDSRLLKVTFYFPC